MPPRMIKTECILSATQGAQTNNPGGEWFKANIGGQESNAKIAGNENRVVFNAATSKEEQETLLRKTGAQVGRLLEGGTDIVVAPAKWLNHMQENWPLYLVCITIILISILLIYCCIRRKATSLAESSSGKSFLSKIIMDEAMKMRSFHPINLEK